MFSSTNLLTSCNSAICLFSAIFGFRKVSKEIFSELDRTNIKVNYFPWEQEVQRRAGGASQGGQTHPRRGWASPHAWLVFDTLVGASASPFSYKKPPMQ